HCCTRTGNAVLRDARPARDLSRGLARVFDPSAARGLGQLRERRVGTLRLGARPLAVDGPCAEGNYAARAHEEPLVLLRRYLQRSAPRRSPGARASARRATACRAPP